MSEKAKTNEDYKSFEKNALKKDEKVLDVVVGFIGDMMGKGKDRQHNGVLVCTNQRVVFYSKGLLSEVNRSIPINKISSIDLDKGLMFTSITIHTSNDEIKVRGNYEEHKKFQDTLEEIRNNQDTNTTSIQQDDPIEKIKKLSELKNQGIISDDEFEQKKKELMDKV